MTIECPVIIPCARVFRVVSYYSSYKAHVVLEQCCGWYLQIFRFRLTWYQVLILISMFLMSDVLM